MAPVDREQARGQRYLTGSPARRFDRVQAVKVFREYLRGLRAVHALHPSVTVFGSGHLREGHPQYALARETGTRLADARFTAMTRGGSGVMEAANRGAQEAGGDSVACSNS